MKKNIIIISVLILLLSTIGMVYFVSKSEDGNDIPQDYIAVFKGESANTVYTTYLYEVKKKKKKTTYKYINTVSTFTGYDSAGWKEKVTKKGSFKKKKEIFKKASKNHADSYVKYMKNDEVYQIEEFKEIFK